MYIPTPIIDRRSDKTKQFALDLKFISILASIKYSLPLFCVTEITVLHCSVKGQHVQKLVQLRGGD